MTSNRIRIAADSVCDLPADLATALHVHIIPTYVNIDGLSIPDDGISLNRERFFRELPSMGTLPTTAAPSPGDAESFYRALLDDGATHIVSIHVPANLSGTLNAMRLGAEAVGEDKVTLVDSLQLTFGIGFQVWAAAELAAAGAPLEAILDAIERVRRHTRVYAIIDTMDYLRRSGRVNALIASIGGLLKIKPIVSVGDGDVSSIARLRTWSRAERRLASLTDDQKPLERLAVLHIANRRGAENYLEKIRDLAPSDTLVIETTPTLGTHIGPGSIGVATLNANWRR
ncbi:MAG: DegV family protein [Chloroflexi bacterium]|nr:DegV family protein [Chloroflexota bacterium]